MRPKDMTLEQLEALPGPVRHKVVLITPENHSKYPSLRVGDTLHIPHMEPGRVGVQEPDDIAFARLSDGLYSFGQFADGSWYKRLVIT